MSEIKNKRIDHNKRAFDMIALLRKNGRMTAAQIMKELDIKTPKSVYNYKKIAEKLEIKIVSYTSIYGGYEILDTHLNEAELIKIKKALKKEVELYNKIISINNRI